MKNRIPKPTPKETMDHTGDELGKVQEHVRSSLERTMIPHTEKEIGRFGAVGGIAVALGMAEAAAGAVAGLAWSAGQGEEYVVDIYAKIMQAVGDAINSTTQTILKDHLGIEVDDIGIEKAIEKMKEHGAGVDSKIGFLFDPEALKKILKDDFDGFKESGDDGFSLPSEWDDPAKKQKFFDDLFDLDGGDE
jgi:hypothetical protein